MIEYRSVPFDVRASAGALPVLAGYAAVFGSRAPIGRDFYEIIERGAFARSLRNNDIRALFDHDTGRVLGRMSSGTLRLEEDATGLRVEIQPPDTATAREVIELVRRRDLSGMSFGMGVIHDDWDDAGDIPLRTLKEIDLFEVSIVSFPAYEDTSIVAAADLGDPKRSARLAAADARLRIAEGQLARTRRAAYARRRAEMEHKFRGLPV